MEHLISNASACEDFMSWVQELQQKLASKLVESVRVGKYEEANAIVGEIDTYSNLQSRLNSEMRERIAQAQYNESRKES
jgi:hypothetical protein